MGNCFKVFQHFQKYNRKGDGQLTVREMNTLQAKDLQWERRVLKYFSA